MQYCFNFGLDVTLTYNKDKFNVFFTKSNEMLGLVIKCLKQEGTSTEFNFDSDGYFRFTTLLDYIDGYEQEFPQLLDLKYHIMANEEHPYKDVDVYFHVD